MATGYWTKKQKERDEDEELDDSLKKQGLIRKHIPGDGACLFRALSEFIFGTQVLHTRVRQQVVDFLKTHRSEYEAFMFIETEDVNATVENPSQIFDLYLQEMARERTWGGEMELNAISRCYLFDVMIHGKDNSTIKIECPNAKKTIHLAFSHGNHYDLVYHQSFLEKAEIVQELLYQILNQKFGTDIADPYVWRNIGYEEYLKDLKNEELKSEKIAQQLDQNEQRLVRLTSYLPPQGKRASALDPSVLVVSQKPLNKKIHAPRAKKQINTQVEYFPDLSKNIPVVMAPDTSAAWGVKRDYGEWAKKPPTPTPPPKAPEVDSSDPEETPLESPTTESPNQKSPETHNKPTNSHPQENSQDLKKPQNRNEGHSTNKSQNTNQQKSKLHQPDQKSQNREDLEGSNGSNSHGEDEPDENALKEKNVVTLNPWQNKSFSQILNSAPRVDPLKPTNEPSAAQQKPVVDEIPPELLAKILNEDEQQQSQSQNAPRKEDQNSWTQSNQRPSRTPAHSTNSNSPSNRNAKGGNTSNSRSKNASQRNDSRRNHGQSSDSSRNSNRGPKSNHQEQSFNRNDQNVSGANPPTPKVINLSSLLKKN